MCTFDLYTESRGRSAVPDTLRRTRLWRFSLCSRFFSTTVILKPPRTPLAGLADLAPDLLIAVADTLALVGFGRPHLADLRRHLADLLLVYTAHDDGRRVRDLELHTLARLDQDRVRVPDLQVHIASLQRGPVADARDLQGLRETFRHAGYGVLDQATSKTVHRLVLGGVRSPLQHEAPVLLPDLDAAPDGDGKLASRPRDLHAPARDLGVHPTWDLDRRLSDT